MSNKVFDIVKDKILEQLDNNVIPWRKTWHLVEGRYGTAFNLFSKRPYHGVNTVLFFTSNMPFYATYKQIIEHGGRVKKGAKTYIVVFWKINEVMEDDKIKKVPILRFYRVFNYNDTEGLEKYIPENFNKPVEFPKCNLIEEHNITIQYGNPAYSPVMDIIYMPAIDDYKGDNDAWHESFFHEVTHWTRHPTRLNRTNGVNGEKDRYAREELVAEVGSSFLMCIYGYKWNEENSIAYIQSWKQKIKDFKPPDIIKACKDAEQATNYLLKQEAN